MEIRENSSRIRFGQLSRGKVVLCDCSLDGGSYENFCQLALEEACSGEFQSRVSYDYGDETSIHVYKSGDLFYLCVTSRVFEKNAAYNCLLELEQELRDAGLQERALVALPYAFRSNFHHRMRKTLTQFSSHDKLGRLQDHVDDVTGIMKTNIGKVMDRGDTLNSLQSRTESLAFVSNEYKKNATKHRRQICWSNAKRWIIICIILGIIFFAILVIIFIVLGARGVFDSK